MLLSPTKYWEMRGGGGGGGEGGPNGCGTSCQWHSLNLSITVVLVPRIISRAFIANKILGDEGGGGPNGCGTSCQ